MPANTSIHVRCKPAWFYGWKCCSVGRGKGPQINLGPPDPLKDPEVLGNLFTGPGKFLQRENQLSCLLESEPQGAGRGGERIARRTPPAFLSVANSHLSRGGWQQAKSQRLPPGPQPHSEPRGRDVAGSQLWDLPVSVPALLVRPGTQGPSPPLHTCA